MALGDALQLAALVFLAGAFWQRTGDLNETLKKMEQSFEKNLQALTERVNDHGERISRIEGRVP